jgi:hypothetical protein
MTDIAWKWRLPAAAATTCAALLGPGTSSAAPTTELSSADCVSKAEKKRIIRGKSKRAVRSMLGGLGVREWRRGRVEQWLSLSCDGARYVVIRFTNGRVTAVKPRAYARLVAADIDANGTTDYYFDADSDGYHEVAVLDANGNGLFETYFVEGAGVQGVFQDRNENGYLEVAGFDSDKDGRFNWMVVDQNEDGVADYTYVDLIGSDGVADTWVAASSPTSYMPPNTSAQQAREANDMMVQHIVTLNQLTQFDPWSPMYLPDGGTPSLLLPDSADRAWP